ncbi:shugoshin [Drosophila busckii]|uniref:shugoshin n=1 Tax=Drosophila busckii TaxID=30019 RepID=UPI00083F11C0|nr:shugoshin [Drosophila busckii]
MEQQYKLLNAQLMHEIQKQRKIIGELQRSEVMLKRQLLEEREKHLSDAQYQETKLKCAIKKMLYSLDLNSEFDIDVAVNTNSQRHSRFSSSQASAELRRSRLVHRSSLPTSPIRRSSLPSASDIQDPEQTVTTAQPTAEKSPRDMPRPRYVSELLLTCDSSDPPTSPDTSRAETQQASRTSTSPEESATQIEQTSPELVGVEIEPDLDTPKLPGIYSIIEENDEDETLSSSFEESRTLLINSSIEASPLPPTEIITTVTVRRGPTPRFCQDAVELVDLEQSIPQVRRATERSPMRISIPDITSNSTPRRSIFDQSLVSRQGACSTPHQAESCTSNSTKSKRGRPRKNGSSTQHQAEPTPRASNATKSKRGRPRKSQCSSSSVSDREASISISQLPSRNCRPTSMIDRDIKSKLRNDTGANLKT